MKREARRPAMIAAPPVAAPPVPLLPAALLAASLVASARPLQINLPKLPNIKLPDIKLPDVKLPDVKLPGGIKLPDLDLPNFGKKAPAATKPAARAPRSAISGNVKVRPAGGGSKTDAPTLADLQGGPASQGVVVNEGWKRFPERRMPGANMQGWKEIAKELTN